MHQLFLKPKKERSLVRKHPWVFSGAVERKEGEIADGDLVEVYSKGGAFLGTGHYQESSILVRMLSFRKEPINQQFWNQKIDNAYRYRQLLGILQDPNTNCYRLVHGEGDGLPGLIVDIYDQTAVVQAHSIGMHRNREEIAAALQTTLGKELQAIYYKSQTTLPQEFSETIQNGYLFGEKSNDIALEHGHQFRIDWEEGQKTGFFLDQRDNRKLLQTYSSGQRVLNTFCYTGGFSIYALQAGAKEVVSVDISAKAMEIVDENVALNGYTAETHTSVKGDVLQYLRAEDTPVFDVVVVDPPAYAKNIRKRHNAIQGYKRLNAAALQKVKKGGIMFTFSCSQVVDRQLFYDTVTAAAIEAGRPVRVMHHLTQPPDHPVQMSHPEGSYLKGLVLEVG